jgi:hypothetical protein
MQSPWVWYFGRINVIQCSGYGMPSRRIAAVAESSLPMNATQSPRLSFYL